MRFHLGEYFDRMLPRSYPEVTQKAGGYQLDHLNKDLPTVTNANRRKNLTDAFIKSLKAADERIEFLDEGYTGRGSLYLRVGTSGKKTWTFLYRFKGLINRKQLGTYPEVSLLHARRAAGETILAIDSGQEPLQIGSNQPSDEQRSVMHGIKLAEMADQYIKNYAMPKKRSWKEDKRILDHDILPTLGDTDISEITRKHIVSLLDNIRKRGAPIAANRTLAVTRKLLNWAVERGDLANNPIIGLKSPAMEHSRDRVLTDAEIVQFWDGLDKTRMSKSVKLALRFMLVTGQRLGEVLQMTYDQVDGNIWMIPANVAKNGHAHRVPLPELALDILEEALEDYNGNIMFRSQKSIKNAIDSFLSPTALSHAVRDSLPIIGLQNVTPHDLRRTAASHITMLGYHRVIVSKILNHVEGGVTTIYDRYGYDKEKEEALNAWSAKLIELNKVQKRFDPFCAIVGYERPKSIRRDGSIYNSLFRPLGKNLR